MVALINLIQKAIPLAHKTVAACIWLSSIIKVVPKPLNIASAIAKTFFPFILLQRHVIDFRTDIAVLGIDLIIGNLFPIISSTRLRVYPVTVDTTI